MSFDSFVKFKCEKSPLLTPGILPKAWLHKNPLEGVVGQPDFHAGQNWVSPLRPLKGFLMHYYKRNIGDYNKKAGRLTMLQHGAYTLLMDACYDRERFPTKDEAIDWCWASTPEEISAVEFVLSKFFLLTNGVYVQTRIEEEVSKFQENAEKNRIIALKREEKRRNRKRSEHEPCTDDEPSDNEPPPNQEPRTKNQEPRTKEKSSARGTRLPADWKLTQEYYEAAKAIRPEWQDNHIRRIAEGFRDHWVAATGQKASKADWLATWRNWCRRDTSKIVFDKNPSSLDQDMLDFLRGAV